MTTNIMYILNEGSRKEYTSSNLKGDWNVIFATNANGIGSNQGIAKARNNIIEHALKNDYKQIYMCDNDVGFENKDGKLYLKPGHLNWEKNIAFGGLCTKRDLNKYDKPQYNFGGHVYGLLYLNLELLKDIRFNDDMMDDLDYYLQVVVNGMRVEKKYDICHIAYEIYGGKESTGSKEQVRALKNLRLAMKYKNIIRSNYDLGFCNAYIPKDEKLVDIVKKNIINIDDIKNLLKEYQQYDNDLDNLNDDERQYLVNIS
jgi:hypothetical protein